MSAQPYLIGGDHFLEAAEAVEKLFEATHGDVLPPAWAEFDHFTPASLQKGDIGAKLIAFAMQELKCCFSHAEALTLVLNKA